MSSISDQAVNVILAVILIVLVLAGLFFIFKNSIIDFIKNLLGGV